MSREFILVTLLIALLLILWGAVFMPAILRARRESSPIVSVGAFRNRMRVLGKGRRAGQWVVMPPMPGNPLADRRNGTYLRRQVFTAMVIGAVASLFLGLIPGMRWMLVVHAVVDVFLAAYIAFLIHLKQAARYLEAASAATAEEERGEATLEPFLKVGGL